MIESFVEIMSQKGSFGCNIRQAQGSDYFTVEIAKPFFASDPIIFHNESRNWVQSRTEKGKGVHEPGLIKTMFALKELYGDKNVDAFFDVGALFGYVSLFASAVLGCKFIYGFEMNPESAALARKNFQLNRAAQSHLHVVEAGAGSHTNLQVPCLYKGFALKVGVTPEEEKQYIPEGFKKADISILSIDDFCKISGVSPNIIKIDTEGTQQSILSGAHQTLTECSPVLLIETDSPSSVNYEDVSMREIATILMEKYKYRIAVFNHRAWNKPITVLSHDKLDQGINLESNQLMVCFPT